MINGLNSCSVSIYGSVCVCMCACGGGGGGGARGDPSSKSGRGKNSSSIQSFLIFKYRYPRNKARSAKCWGKLIARSSFIFLPSAER